MHILSWLRGWLYSMLVFNAYQKRGRLGEPSAGAYRLQLAGNGLCVRFSRAKSSAAAHSLSPFLSLARHRFFLRGLDSASRVILIILALTVPGLTPRRTASTPLYKQPPPGLLATSCWSPNLVHTHQKSLAIFFGSFLSPLPTARARSYLATAAAAALSPLLAHRLEIDHLARRRR